MIDSGMDFLKIQIATYTPPNIELEGLLDVDNKDKIGRNDPCHEGCGIKYKKCGIDDRCIKISETK